MRVLITGFDGFIGSHLAEHLKKKHDIFGITHYSVGKKIAVDFPYAFVDITENFQVRNILREVKPDVIIHLAAQSSVSRSFERPEEYMKANLIGTINLAEAAMREVPNFKRFIHASTPEVYGRQEHYPTSEDANPNPTTPYAVSKYAADLYLKYMHQAYNFPVVISRNANCYGRKAGIFSNLGVIENIITQMLKGDTVNLGDGEVRRDFIYIEDVCRWYETLLTEGTLGEVYNVTSGENHNIMHVVQTCAELIGWEGRVNYNTLPKRAGEMKNIELDMVKAKNDFQFMTYFCLKTGLMKTIDYWRGHI